MGVGGVLRGAELGADRAFEVVY